MTTSLWYGGPDASRLELPLVPLDPPARPNFSAPEKEQPLAGVSSEGDTWPPQDWTVTHDVLAGSTRVAWSGNDSSTYPWGKMKDHEQMSYLVADAKPAESTVHGEGSTTVRASGSRAGLERPAQPAERRKEFLLSLRAPSNRKWQAAARQNLGGDGSRVTISKVRNAVCHPERSEGSLFDFIYSWDEPGAKHQSAGNFGVKNTAILLVSCPDQKGLNAAIHDFIYRGNGNTLHADEHQDAERNLFLMRVEWDLDGFHARYAVNSPSTFSPSPIVLECSGAWRFPVIARKSRFSFRATIIAWWICSIANAAANSPAKFL